jgi:DNA-binding NarL/FixJ family response regulator
MVTDALEAAGVTVLVALDGRAALDILGRITPDVILVDAVMPGMDGFETCRQIKARPALSHIPVIFMTGLTETTHILQGLEAGGVDYLTKPIVPEVLIARMRVHLANARSGHGARSALDAAGRHLFCVTNAGHLVWSTPEATRLLATAGVAAEALPATLGAWLRGAGSLAQAGAPAGAHGAPAAASIALAADVVVEQVGLMNAGEILLRLSRTGDERGLQRLRGRFGLTLREADVLVWLAQGKSNRDIAAILGLSPRTVDKHLEQIFPKLGVENRASAATLATRALGMT